MAEGGDTDHEPGIVWACTECGRHHQKHSPPCNRCGNVHLEKRTPDYSDLEAPGGTSYLDVLEPKYALGYLAVIGFAVLVALSLAGIVSVPWLGGPNPPGAPGDAETYGNVSLDEVEGAYVADIDQRRSALGVNLLSQESRLTDVATEFNQRRVRAAVDGESSPSLEDIYERYEPACDARTRYDNQTAPVADVFDPDAASPTADSVASNLPIAPGEDSALFAGRYDTIGVDVHVSPDDRVFATVVIC